MVSESEDNEPSGVKIMTNPGDYDQTVDMNLEVYFKGEVIRNKVSNRLFSKRTKRSMLAVYHGDNR